MHTKENTPLVCFLSEQNRQRECINIGGNTKKTKDSPWYAALSDLCVASTVNANVITFFKPKNNFESNFLILMIFLPTSQTTLGSNFFRESMNGIFTPTVTNLHYRIIFSYPLFICCFCCNIGFYLLFLILIHCCYCSFRRCLSKINFWQTVYNIHRLNTYIDDAQQQI